MAANDYVVVAGPGPAADADAAFEEWLEVFGARRDQFGTDLLVDTGGADYGMFRRYRIRRTALPRTGLNVLLPNMDLALVDEAVSWHIDEDGVLTVELLDGSCVTFPCDGWVDVRGANPRAE